MALDPMADPTSETSVPTSSAAESTRDPLSWVLPLVIVIGVLLRIEVLSRPMAEVAGRFLIDDSFIACDIARSVANGSGPAAGGQLTNGFQPLWIVLLAPLYWVLGEPALYDIAAQDLGVRLALGLGLACDIGLIAAILAESRRRHGLWSPAVILAASYWALSPRVLQTTFNGLETVLVLAAFHALSAWRARMSEVQGSASVMGGVTGVLGAILLLSRIDQAIALAVFFLLEIRRFRDPRFLAASVLAFAVPVVLWSLWIWGWTGHVYPVSGEASRLQSSPSPELLTRTTFHLFIVWVKLVEPAIWLLVGAALATVWSVALAGRAELIRQLGIYGLHLLSVLGIVMVYVVHQGGWWYFARYLALFDWAVVLWLGAMLDSVVRCRPKWQLNVRFGAVAFSALLGFLHPLYERYTFVTPPGSVEKSYRSVALWAREGLPPGATVGAVQSGALGYYATNLRVLNLDGVTNADALEAIKKKRLVEYALSEGMTFFVGPHGNFEYLIAQESDAALAGAFELVGKGPSDGFIEAPWLVFVTGDVPEPPTR